MYSRFSKERKLKHNKITAAVLTCAAVVYAAAGCCGPNEAIIHDECFDAGVTDGGDAGSDNNVNPDCN